MNSEQRACIRDALLKAGFERATHEYPDRPDFYDRGLTGAYTEIWRHKLDRTTIELKWDVKEPGMRPRPSWKHRGKI